MNSNFLEVVSYESAVKHTRRGSKTPLLMEFQVNPELAPFLVSSSRSVQWVSHASESGHVRAAIRKRHGLEAELLAAILHLGQEAQWGNTHPLTTDGVLACIEHLAFYGIVQVQLLVGPDTDLTGVELPPHVLHGVASWVPRDALVVVPLDRNFVGTLGTMGQHKAVAVVHNASRGVAVAWR